MPLLLRSCCRAIGWGCGLLLGLLPPAPAAAQPAPAAALLRQRLSTAATDTGRVRALQKLADVHLYTHFDSAWAYARQAQALAQQLNDPQGLYRSYGQLGILYGMKGNAEASLRMFLRQLRLNEARPDSARWRPGILSNIANSYYSLGKYRAATGLLLQARRADAQARDTAGLLSDLNNLTQLLIKQQRFNEALRTGQEAARLARRYRHGQQEPQSVLFLVSALHETRQYAAARDTCLRVLPTLPDGQSRAYAYHLLLRDYLALHQLPAAEQAGLRALRAARPAGMLDVQRDVLATLAEVSAAAGDPATGYRRQRAAQALTERLTRQSNAKTVQDMQFKYDTEQKDQHLLALGQQVRSSRWQAGLGSGLALVALLAVGFVYRAKQLQTQVFRQRDQLRAQQAAQAAQLVEARQQLEAASRRELELELAGSQRELASAALFTQQKTRLLEDLTGRLETLARRVPETQRAPVADMKKAIRQHLNVAGDWEKVTLHFEKIHPEFFAQLRHLSPALTPNELKQCAYVKLNLSNKEIAALLNIEAGSVKISHYRIKKKMGLEEGESLRSFILSI